MAEGKQLDPASPEQSIPWRPPLLAQTPAALVGGPLAAAGGGEVEAGAGEGAGPDEAGTGGTRSM